jgi:hypothetical protein
VLGGARSLRPETALCAAGHTWAANHRFRANRIAGALGEHPNTWQKTMCSKLPNRTSLKRCRRGQPRCTVRRCPALLSGCLEEALADELPAFDPSRTRKESAADVRDELIHHVEP